MKSSRSNLEQIFETQIQTLALTLRPNSVKGYRTTARCFLAYLRTAFPQVRRLSQLRRDPHLLGWFRSLCEHQPPLRREPASTISFSSGGCSRSWPPTAIPFSPISFVGKTSLHDPAIFLDLFPSRTINSCSRSCAVPMISTPMPSCSSVPPESASANASTCHWTA